MSSAATTSTTAGYQQRPKTLTRTSPRKAARGILGTASTPNLNVLYSAQAGKNRLAPAAAGLLAHKASQAALTPSSLAAIPDDSDNYPFLSVLNDENPPKMPPMTPGRAASAAPQDDFDVGDTVDVPGGMHGTVRFVGSVAGKKGTFAGVELHPDFFGRGKNNGEVDGSATSHGVYPNTPSALRAANHNTTNYTPPTPALPKFSQSVGPGRAASPTGRKSRISLPRPESPVRKLQLSPANRGSATTPVPRAPSRYGTPSIGKFSASVRGTAGDPAKPPSMLDRKPSIVPRSVSALDHQAGPQHSDEDEITPIVNRSKTNGSIGSIGSLRLRAGSRAGSRAAAHAADEEEIERLKAQLAERDMQLKDQASALAEMESSVQELTSLMENTDMSQMRRNSHDDKDTSQLRALLREKNEKIAILTGEFDVHRADFRSTIDTLEMASTETQRVYDARIRELEQEIHELQERNDDVESVARQLKQLEELVQELEEGLEDARRGEAEARGEVEFLRGEVERTRAELRKEREKSSAAINGSPNGDAVSSTKELEKKDDEIRGLKAIIHSLSRDGVSGGDSTDRTSAQFRGSNDFANPRNDSIEARTKRDQELSELRALVDTKNNREEELERELEALRRNSATTHRGSGMTLNSSDRNSYRDSKGTVILAREAQEPKHKRVPTMDTMAESDAYSSVTESSTLWCEICETGGHDILTCSNMFGNQEQGKAIPDDARAPKDTPQQESSPNLDVPAPEADIMPRPLTPVKSTPATHPPPANVQILPNPTDSGPLAGKESGVVDIEKWCALCERDGHDSIDCPLEDAF
ncbi:Glycoside hydrolase, 38 vacuolar alpha mannosidase [Pestalotiopsis sp. IQ-011]